MQNFQIKTIPLRECRNCKMLWASERERLEPGDQINIAKVIIAYCPACAEGYGQEFKRPTYERRTGKRIK